MPLSHSLDFEGHQIPRKLNSEFQQPHLVGQTWWGIMGNSRQQFSKDFCQTGQIV